MRLIDYFDRAVVINLPERSDRRTETIQEFRRVKWPIENEKINFFPAIKPETSEGFPSAGVRGCYLSHYNAIKQAQVDNLANILVMEDDISFVSRIDKYAPAVIDSLEKTNWGFLYLGHEYSAGKSLGKPLEKITVPLPLAHFYAVNGRIFNRFLYFLEQLVQRKPGDPTGGPMHYDGAISTFRMQSLGYQRSSCTDLHQLSYLDQWPILIPATRQFRKLKNAIKRLHK